MLNFLFGGVMDLFKLAIFMVIKETDSSYSEGSISSKVLEVIKKQCQENSYFKTQKFIVEMPSLSCEISKLTIADDMNKSVFDLYNERSYSYLDEICNNFGYILDVYELDPSKKYSSVLNAPFKFECTKVHVVFANHKKQLKELVSTLERVG